LLSVIVLTFNSIKFIKPCLDSVFSQGYKDFEVIIVDNGSSDGTGGFIKDNYPQVALIENNENLGAAKARNQGIERARGDWVLTLDCDVVLEKDFFIRFSNAVKNLLPQVGMIQPKILRADRKTIYSAGIFLSKIRRFYDIGKEKADSSQFNAQKYVFGACSAAAFYKRQMLTGVKEETGYFDERFFFLVEDVDLSWRAQRKGWQVLYYPEVMCYHFGNSSCHSSKFRQYLSFRNRYFAIIKNDCLKHLLINLPVIIAYDMTRLLCLSFTNREVLKALKEITSLYLLKNKKIQYLA
jgi:GT2 family glycosyltransferase